MCPNQLDSSFPLCDILQRIFHRFSKITELPLAVNFYKIAWLDISVCNIIFLQYRQYIYLLCQQSFNFFIAEKIFCCLTLSNFLFKGSLSKLHDHVNLIQMLTFVNNVTKVIYFYDTIRFKLVQFC